MSRFYFSWFGNKRAELSHVDAATAGASYDVVVEPFAGSAALSLELYAREPTAARRFVVNDADPHLVGLMRFVREHSSEPLFQYCRERLNAEEFKRHHKVPRTELDKLTTEQYFYRMRVTGTFCRVDVPPEKWPRLERSARHVTTDAFFASPQVTITREDWRECAARYAADPRALIFLDPPYFNSFNQEYYGLDRVKTDETGKILDGTAMFIEILELLKTAAARVIVITNSCAIVDHLFAPFIAARYPKTYGRVVPKGDGYVRKSTEHILLDNRCLAASRLASPGDGACPESVTPDSTTAASS